jgi:hypothetical protein
MQGEHADLVILSGALRGETVALAQRDDGDWAVRFRDFDFAVLADETGKIRRCKLARTAKYTIAAATGDGARGP